MRLEYRNFSSPQNGDGSKDKEKMPHSRGMLNLEENQHKEWISVLICLALTILTIITFSSLKDCGFINLDDPVYVYENSYIQSGLNVKSIGQAFSSELAVKSGNWHPVTWLSLMLDYQIFGLNPSGYHLINLFFHVMNTVLLFLIVRRMTKTIWPSAFIAALFAIHPIHVESVAWIAERKDVLSAFFWMLTMGAYSYYVKHPGLRRYFFVLLFFVLGLMAKPMLVTLPFVLLLLDYWPLQRFQEIRPDYKIPADVFMTAASYKQKQKSKKAKAATETLEAKKPANPEYKWTLIYSLLWEKAPLFVLTIISSIVTYIAQQKGGAVSTFEAVPFGVRIGNAFISYITYIGKTIWPSNFAVVYPHTGLLPLWQVWGSIFPIIGITLVVIWKAKRTPYLATGWLWYTGALVPVIGIVQVGPQAMADRYTYIPLIGLFIIVAWGVPDLLEKWNCRKEILLASSAVSILCLSLIAWRQVGYWRNNIALYGHTLKVTDYNWLIYNHRGASYYSLGNYMQAIEDFNKAIKIKPDDAAPYYNRGMTYNSLGNYRQAIEDCDKAIEIKPSNADAYINRSIAYNGIGNYRRAIENLNKAIEIRPGYASAYVNRGNAYRSLGNYKQAMEEYNMAIRLKDDFALTYHNRGTLYAMLGQYQPAIEDLNKAISLDPNDIKAYNNRGLLFTQMGSYQKGLENFNEAIHLKSDYADAYRNRASVYLNQGDTISGCRDARTACKLGDCKTLEVANARGLCR
jgi:protein O-mannosyl-transferase